MLRRPLSFDDREAMAEAMRRRHSDWLSGAFRRGRRLPRIPTRPAEEGGFEALMGTPEGSAWAAEFWVQTLDRPDLC